MTAFGRDTLKKAIKFVADKGYKVIFADTDGLMLRAVTKNGNKKRKIDHEQQLSDIAEEFNQQINPDGTKYSRLVFKGTWDRICMTEY
jgi:DNA polymerase elongation subunit (family B)